MKARLADRLGLLLVGVVLLSLGGYGLVRHLTGVPGEVVSGVTPWTAWYAIGGAALLTAVLGARWLFGMVTPQGRGKRTGIGTAMLGVALKGIEGLRWLHVVLVRRRSLRIFISCDRDADLPALRKRIDDSAVARVRRQLGNDDLPTLVRLHLRR